MTDDLKAVFSQIKWDLSDKSRETVRLVLDTTQSAEIATKVAMRLAVLEYERDGARTEKQQISERYAAREEPTRQMVERLWDLWDRKRKTLPMEALRAALMGEASPE